jgi:hypothetical protein
MATESTGRAAMRVLFYLILRDIPCGVLDNQRLVGQSLSYAFARAWPFIEIELNQHDICASCRMQALRSHMGGHAESRPSITLAGRRADSFVWSNGLPQKAQPSTSLNPVDVAKRTSVSGSDRVDLHKPHDARQLSGVSNPASEA